MDSWVFIVYRSIIEHSGGKKTYSASKHGIGTHAKASKSKWQFLETASAGERPQSWYSVLELKMENVRRMTRRDVDRARLILKALDCRTDFQRLLSGKGPSLSFSEVRVS